MTDRYKRIEHILNGVRCGTIGTLTATEKIIEMFNSDGGYAVLGDGWRDAKKEVPEYKFIMLVFCDGCGDVDYYSFGRYEDGRWIDKFDSCVLDVIAWRPLPDPPAFH